MFCRKCMESTCATQGCKNVILRNLDNTCIECVKARGLNEKTYNCGQCHVRKIHTDLVRDNEGKITWRYTADDEKARKSSADKSDDKSNEKTWKYM